MRVFLERGVYVIKEPVEGLAGPHDSLHLGGIRVIVAPDVHTLPLALYQLLGDLRLCPLELLSETPPGSVPRGQSLGPVESEVVVTTSVIQLSHLQTNMVKMN